MRLIYAHIRHFRNIENQEVFFSDDYDVKIDPEKKFPDGLTIVPKEQQKGAQIIHKGSYLSNVHLFVGKTGAGKTNLFQMIGMPEEERCRQREEKASYFMLYEAEDSFVVELYSTPGDGLSALDLPTKGRKQIGKHTSYHNPMKMYKFSLSARGTPKRVESVSSQDQLDSTIIINGYDRKAFPFCPYEEERAEGFCSNTSWQTRINAEYDKTALEYSCEFLGKYIDSFDVDSIKHNAALVIYNQNWAETVKQYIPEELEDHDYWTYIDRLEQEKESGLLQKKIRKTLCPSVRKQFIHDLLTDYALYLREWISYAYSDEISPKEKKEPINQEQEYLDYLLKKEQEELTEKKRRINPSILPDLKRMKIQDRLEWLSMWIDRKENGIAKHILWQIYDDIKDIAQILGKFNKKYFTNKAFRLPIKEMYTAENKPLVDELLERMEQYRPDEYGIFSKELLPYHFSHISSGEYQFAKILGGIKEYCVKLSIGKGKEDKEKPNLIYLLDEPETYMHPELCRLLLKNIDEILCTRTEKRDLQIFITTHSPFLLSDVLPEQITRLDLDSKGYCIIKNKTDKAYFGANIHTILSDGFFLEYTIGEFARKVLQEKLNKMKQGEIDDQEVNAILPLLGDTVIKHVFESYLNERIASHEKD